MRPNLVDKYILKPVIPQNIKENIKENISEIIRNSIVVPEFDNQSITILINLAFVITITLIILWLYNLYIDRKNTLITKIEEIFPTVSNIHPILQNPNNIVIPSNIEEVPENFNYIH